MLQNGLNSLDQERDQSDMKASSMTRRSRVVLLCTADSYPLKSNFRRLNLPPAMYYVSLEVAQVRLVRRRSIDLKRAFDSSVTVR